MNDIKPPLPPEPATPEAPPLAFPTLNPAPWLPETRMSAAHADPAVAYITSVETRGRMDLGLMSLDGDRFDGKALGEVVRLYLVI